MRQLWHEQHRQCDTGSLRRGDAASVGRLQRAGVGRRRRVVLGCKEKPGECSDLSRVFSNSVQFGPDHCTLELHTSVRAFV